MHGIGDIKEYLRGKATIDETLPLADHASLVPRTMGAGLYATEPRTEADMVDMLGRAQAEREQSLRDQIHEEELARKYQTVDRDDLDQLGQQRRAEIEEMSLETDAAREREKRAESELRKMQAELVSRE